MNTSDDEVDNLDTYQEIIYNLLWGYPIEMDFTRSLKHGFCCEGVVNGKVEIIYFFTRVFVIGWQNETGNFFVF